MRISKNFYKSLFLITLLICVSFYFYIRENKQNEYNIIKTEFSELPEWNSKNILPSLKSFKNSCSIILNKSTWNSEGLLDLKIKRDGYINFCNQLSAAQTSDNLKKLIEDNFVPVYLNSKETLFTGYVELEIMGRLEPSVQEAPNAVPIFKKPTNIIPVNLEKFGEEYKEKKIIGMIEDNDFIPVPSRKVIQNQQKFKEHILAYVDDPALAYFLHIQGSGVITLPSGEKLSVGYAGDNGKPYYSIGKKLIEDGIIKKENMSMQSILAWMRNNREAAFELMQRNDRFIFFKERNNLEPPKGSSGVNVSAMHSAAVDNSFVPYHLPLWAQVDHFYSDRENKRLINIFIAQDTGSAIKGAARIDLFLGKGKVAEFIAGKLNSKGKIWLFLPK